MSQELEEERQRRTKAEMAAGRLVEHVRSLQTQLEENIRGQELAVARAAKLDRELKGEREKTTRLEGEVRKVQELLEAARCELEVERRRVGKLENTLRSQEEDNKKRDANHAAERTDLVSKTCLYFRDMVKEVWPSI